MSFKEIVGQESALALLKTAYGRKHVAHAYVFVGPQDENKRKAAANFAKLLVCDDPQGQEPCDKCSSCRKVEAFNHPDVQWVSPQGAFIRIDDIREACRRLNLKGFESTAKVLIIDDAQSLNEESSNALLKTLEEPSPQTVILLLADTLKSLLPTIRSRCQKVVFAALGEKKLVSMLQERLGIEGAQALYLARIGEGRVTSALKFHEDGLFARKNKIIRDALDRRCRLDALLELSAGDRLQKGEKIDEVLWVLASWFRDMLLAKMSVAPENFINADAQDEVRKAAAGFSVGDIEERIRSIAEAAAQKDRNINMRVLMTNLRVELWK